MNKRRVFILIMALILVFAGAAAGGGDDDFMKAIAKGRLDFVKNAVFGGADVNMKDKNGFTPLMLAANFGHVDIVKYLVENGARIDDTSKNGDTALAIAEVKGNAEIADYLRRKSGKAKGEENKASEDGKTVAEAPATKKKGPKISGEELKSMNEELLRSILMGNIDKARELVSRGADVNCANSKGETPLILAIHQHLRDLAYFLAENGADVNLADSQGFSAFQYAIFNESETFIRKLFEKGADLKKINDVNGKGKTLLIECIEKKVSLEVIKYLTEKGADVNIPDSKGRPSLYFAIKTGSADMVKFLIEKGVKIADVNIRDENGKTMLVLCMESEANLDEAAAYLISKGADQKGVFPKPIALLRNKALALLSNPPEGGEGSETAEIFVNIGIAYLENEYYIEALCALCLADMEFTRIALYCSGQVLGNISGIDKMSSEELRDVTDRIQRSSQMANIFKNMDFAQEIKMVKEYIYKKAVAGAYETMMKSGDSGMKTEFEVVNIVMPKIRDEEFIAKSLEFFVKACSSKMPVVSSRAISGIASAFSPGTLQPLLQNCGDYFHSDIIEHLVVMRNDAEPVLLADFTKLSAFARSNAAFAFGISGNAKNADKLKEFLKNEKDAIVAIHLHYSLARFGEEASFKALLAGLKNQDKKIALASIRALQLLPASVKGKIDYKNILPLADETDSLIKYFAVILLGEITEKKPADEVIDKLATMIGENDYKDCAREALKKMKTPHCASAMNHILKNGKPAEKASAIIVLGNVLGDGFVPDIENIIKDTAGPLKNAEAFSNAFGNSAQNSRENAEFIEKTFGGKAAAELKNACVEALGDVGTERCVKKLVDIAGENSDFSLKAVISLFRIKGVDPKKIAANFGPEPNLYEKFYTAAACGDSMLEALEAMMGGSHSTQITYKGLMLASILRYEKLIPTLKSFVRENSADNRSRYYLPTYLVMNKMAWNALVGTVLSARKQSL